MAAYLASFRAPRLAPLLNLRGDCGLGIWLRWEPQADCLCERRTEPGKPASKVPVALPGPEVCGFPRFVARGEVPMPRWVVVMLGRAESYISELAPATILLPSMLPVMRVVPLARSTLLPTEAMMPASSSYPSRPYWYGASEMFS